MTQRKKLFGNDILANIAAAAPIAPPAVNESYVFVAGDDIFRDYCEFSPADWACVVKILGLAEHPGIKAAGGTWNRLTFSGALAA